MSNNGVDASMVIEASGDDEVRFAFRKAGPTLRAGRLGLKWQELFDRHELVRLALICVWRKHRFEDYDGQEKHKHGNILHAQQQSLLGGRSCNKTAEFLERLHRLFDYRGFPDRLWLGSRKAALVRQTKPRRAGGADLTFATHLPQSPYANVKSKAPPASTICSGPLILTFAKAALQMGSEC
jgi:hypothetical protein